MWFGNPVLSAMLTDQDKPANYTKAMEGPESDKWLEAMKSEIRSMYDNQVWTLVDIPSNRKAVENKWIFKKKTDADGNVTIYKARLIAKGFRQIQGVDYDETFSPVEISLEVIIVHTFIFLAISSSLSHLACNSANILTFHQF
jgi:hypothetical protein